MRRMIWILLFGAAIWSTWWLFASYNLSREINAWFDARRADGWQADLRGVHISGFPFHLNATIEAPALGDPQTGLAFDAGVLTFSAPAWWPGYVTLDLPQDGINFATPRAKSTLIIKSGRAEMRLHPGEALELQSLVLSSAAWQVDVFGDRKLSADGLDVTLTQDAEEASAYRLTASVAGLRPAATARTALRVPQAVPESFDSLQLDLKVRLTRPIDIQTLEVSRPQPQQLDLTLADATWGPMQLRAAASLQIDDRGLANGAMSFQARNWRGMLDLLENAELLPQQARPQFENILGMIANGGGNADALDIAFEARDGRLFLGFIPVAQLAPVRIP